MHATNNARGSDAHPDIAPRSETTATALAAHTLDDQASTVFTSYAHRDAVVDLSTGDRITYGWLWRTASHIAAALQNSRDHPVRQGDFVATIGATGADAIVAELALIRLGAVLVPLAADATAVVIDHVLGETTPRAILCAPSQIERVNSSGAAGSAPILSLALPEFDQTGQSSHEPCDAVTDSITSLADLARVGAATRVRPASPGLDELAGLLYTSGSTGLPKGVEYTGSMVRSLWRSEWLLDTTFAAVTLGVLPLHHYAGRASLWSTLLRGGTVYLPSVPNLASLTDDLSVARPTTVLLVPRLVELVRQRFLATPDADVEDAAAVGAFGREVFGDRLTSVVIGSAPLGDRMRAFLRDCVGQDFLDAYGTTELGTVLIDGAPVPDADVTLDQIPELHTGTSGEVPRGELVVRTGHMFSRYFHRPDATAKAFDNTGRYRTGDIMELRDNRYVYVDRRSSVFKLSNGEFVSPANVEGVYASSPLIHQIYVHGAADLAYLTAVVVPDTEVGGPNIDESTVLAEFTRLGEQNSLRSFEIPAVVLIEPAEFHADDGLVSSVGKNVRPRLAERYGERLAALADRHDSDAAKAIRVATESITSAREGVPALVKAMLSLDGEVPLDATFVELGGDSLSATTLATHLTKAFAVDLPVNVIASPGNTIGDIIALVDGADSGGATSADTVHPSADTLAAEDLTLGAFLPAEVVDGARRLPPARTAQSVLVTGANGYLGRFVLLEHLEGAAQRGGTVIALVRASDARAAAARLREVFASSDELLRRYDAASSALEVVAGDVAKQHLGLDEQTWERLGASVDHIVHPAAFVNHALPYRELFGPNVVGTAEVIRLALTQRRKSIAYISSISVQWSADGEVDESADIRTISPRRPVTEDYANGYANSKWAGEVLLRNAHDAADIPIRIFRSDMILAHRTFAGQVNTGDVLTRLMVSILDTGTAPDTFYATPHDAELAHYEGLPVDFVAASIHELGPATSGFATFNVLNSRDDGPNLNRIIEWLAADRNPLDRTKPYRTWWHDLAVALDELPTEERAKTLAPVINAYRTPGRADGRARDKSSVFRRAVETHRIDTTGTLPLLTPEYIQKYVADLDQLGLVKR